MKIVNKSNKYFECNYKCASCTHNVCDELDTKAIDNELIKEGVYDKNGVMKPANEIFN